jgi:hypothetical protein
VASQSDLPDSWSPPASAVYHSAVQPFQPEDGMVGPGREDRQRLLIQSGCVKGGGTAIKGSR